MLNSLKRRPLRGVAAVVVLLLVFAGGLTVGRRRAADHTTHAHEPVDAGDGAEVAAQTWTCSMHPQIKQPEPGLCPICAMDLIPLADDSGDDLGPRELKLSAAARSLARIQVEPATRLPVHREVRMAGTVDYDETRLATISAWVGGRLDRLYVDYTGIAVQKGDHMVLMYSPDLLAAQEELIQAGKAADELAAARDSLIRRSAEATLAASRDKLRLWGLTAEQIQEVEARGTASDQIQINAPAGGVVIHKNAVEGAYVKTGTPIYRIADLTQVWVRLDAYESDLPWLRYGQDVTFTVEGQPARTFTGRIAFIDPLLSNRTRTVKVRVNVPNEDGALKPGMFVRAVARVQVGVGGSVVAPDLAGKWISPMHPEVVKDGPGSCDVCGMPLVKAEELGFTGPAAAAFPLVIPSSAPLLTGRRAVIYVQSPDDESRFEGREVVLGPRTEAHYVVDSGLEEGELVVVNGNFKIDSALQIVAKPSMMSPDGGGAPAGRHHGGHSAHGKPAAAVTERVSAPKEFIAQLDALFGSYLEIQQALAGDEPDDATKAAAEFLQHLAAIDMKLLDGPAHVAWMKSRDALRAASARVRKAKDVAAVRQAFETLSNEGIRVAKTFGTSPALDLQVAHCPMAFDNRGADWLQADTTIANPYYGSAMLRCGEIKSTIGPAADGKVEQADVPTMAPPYTDLPPGFSKQLTAALDAYFDLQKALSQDNAKAAGASAAALNTRLEAIDASQLDQARQQTWRPIAADLKKSSAAVTNGQDIDGMREGFALVSESMTAAVRQFGNRGLGQVVKVHCPMAFNDRGASWLQRHTEVENPYFGAAMFRCGAVTETLVQPEDEPERTHRHE